MKVSLIRPIPGKHGGIRWLDAAPDPIRFEVREGRIVFSQPAPREPVGEWADDQLSVICKARPVRASGHVQDITLSYENRGDTTLHVVAPFHWEMGIVRGLHILDPEGREMDDMMQRGLSGMGVGQWKQYRASATPLPPGTFFGIRKETTLLPEFPWVRSRFADIDLSRCSLQLRFCEHLVLENWPDPPPAEATNHVSNCGIFSTTKHCQVRNTTPLLLQMKIPSPDREAAAGTVEK